MTIRRVKVSELCPHPLQNEVYGNLPMHEFVALKDDIARRGVRTPIEITSSKLIVDGHQRVRACKELAIDEIDAVICKDEGRESIDESFVLANFMRRQLDPVSKAKALQKVVEMERRRGGSADDIDPGDLRDRIAKRLGGNISGRTVDRLLQLIRLPAPIHQAVSAGALTMTKALRLEKLPQKVLTEIAVRITAGEPARSVVDAFLPCRKLGNHETPADLYRMLIDFLAENLPSLEGSVPSLPGAAGQHESVAVILDRSAVFFTSMRERELASYDEALKKIEELTV